MAFGTVPDRGPLIVIPCLNEARHIGGLVDQFLKVAHRLSGRVVVVDGGSTDGTRALVETRANDTDRVVLLDNPARIQSAGINLAVDRFGAKAGHLIRIDAHCAYPDDYCDHLLAEAERTGAASVVVSMVATGEGRLQSAIAAAQNSNVGNGGSQHRHASDGAYVEHGHHALMRITAFKEVGGYDGLFTHNEDAELDHRLRAAGHKIWLTGGTQATYFPRQSLVALARQYFNHGSGRARMLAKHRRAPNLRQVKVIMVWPMAVAASLAPVSAVFTLPAYLWLAYCIVSAIRLSVERRDVRVLYAAPASMVMHLAWSCGFWSETFARLGRTRPEMAR